jgi:hypothetical protein
VRRLLRDPTGYSYSLKKDEVIRMARQIKNKSCCEQVEKRNITSRTSLFGTVKNVFKLNHSKSAENIPSYVTAGKSENSEVIAIQTKVEAAEAQLRRVQMVQ